MTDGEILNNLNRYILNKILINSDKTTNIDTVDIYNMWIHDNSIIINNPRLTLIALEQINMLKHFDAETMKTLL